MYENRTMFLFFECFLSCAIYMLLMACPPPTLSNSIVLRSRERFQQILRDQNIAEELVLNYDQTWMTPYRCPKTTLRHMRQKGSRNEVRLLNITGARAGISLCTSSWMNGDRGPLFVSIGCKSCKQSWIDEMNETLVWLMCVDCSGCRLEQLQVVLYIL